VLYSIVVASALPLPTLQKKQLEKYNFNPDLDLGLDPDLLRRRIRIQIKQFLTENIDDTFRII
jgi:hypothetical protein